MLVHIRPVIIWFDHSLDSPLGNGLWPVLCPTTVLTVSPPSAQSPFAQCGCDLPLRRRSFRLLGGHYSSFFAPTDSFVSRSSPLLRFFCLVEGVFAGCLPVPGGKLPLGRF